MSESLVWLLLGIVLSGQGLLTAGQVRAMRQAQLEDAMARHPSSAGSDDA